MPRVSRIPVRPSLHYELEEQFSFLISSLHSAKDISSFFQEFLSKEERGMLLKRLMLYLLLEKGYPTSDITSILGITRETIRIHKQMWERSTPQYKQVIIKLAEREKTKLFWKKVDTVLKPLDLVLRAKRDMRARRKLESGEIE